MVTSVLSRSVSITAVPPTTSIPTARVQRHFDIDHMKCLLTIVMIYGHVWMLLGNTFGGTWYTVFGLLARPGIFSGFLFCFGYAVWVSYFQRPVLPWKRMFRSAWKCYVAYAISGCAYQVLVHDQKASFGLLFRVFALLEIPGMSEYLLAFALVIALAAAFPRIVRFATQTPLHTLGATVICLILTHFKADQSRIPIVGLFVGQLGSECFPVLPYLPLFLFGAFVGRHQVKFTWRHALIASVGAGLFAVVSLWWPGRHLSPHRFPPNATWIIGSACIMYFFFGFGKLVCRLPLQLQRFSNSIGQNVLFYLTVSNLCLFTCVALGAGSTLNHGLVVLVTAAFLTGIFFLQYIVVDYARVGQMMAQRPPESARKTDENPVTDPFVSVEKLQMAQHTVEGLLSNHENGK